MKQSHIHLLFCIECGGALQFFGIHHSVIKGDEIETGALSCTSCEAVYPVIDGVGLFFNKDVRQSYLNHYEKQVISRIGLELPLNDFQLGRNQQKQIDVARNWSYQWNKAYDYGEADFSQEGFLKEDIFFKFIPIEPDLLNNKTVVIWCGGRGREAYHVAKHNPKLLIVNEIGDEIYAIKKLLSDHQNLLLTLPKTVPF